MLGTGTREIIEASPNDQIWALRFNALDAERREHECGQNKLGKALMRVREKLRYFASSGEKDRLLDCPVFHMHFKLAENAMVANM